MKGLKRVAHLMWTDREWAALGACIVGLVCVSVYVAAAAGPAGMLGLGLGLATGSLVTGIINQMGRWS